MASLERYKALTHPSDQDPSWQGSPHPKIEKNKCVLKWSLGKIQCFKPMFFFVFFFLVENRVLTPPLLSGIFHYFFFFNLYNYENKNHKNIVISLVVPYY